jgi:uncharacterized protein YukE
MALQEDVLAWARRHATEVQKDMTWNPGDHVDGGWWTAQKQDLPRLTARATAALDFFARYAGPESEWTRRANQLYENSGHRQSFESGVHALGDMLMEWAKQVEHGLTEMRLARQHIEIEFVATDLMSQVRKLNEDSQSHPAAAMVLAGAALEIALRSAVDAHGLNPEGKQLTISKLAQVLRSNELLSRQEMRF